MKAKFKSKLLSILLVIVMVLVLVPVSALTAFAAGDGLSEETAIEVNDYTTFKAAMEDPTIGYVKISNNFSSTITSQTGNMIAGTMVSTPKVLIVNADATFVGSAAGNADVVDSLILTSNGANLTVKGTGTLRFKANGSASANAVIRVDGGTVNVQDSVTIHGTYNSSTYGCAIVLNNGDLNLLGGVLKGESVKYSNTNYLGALELRGGNTVINDDSVVVENKYSGTNESGEHPDKLTALNVAESAWVRIHSGTYKLTEGVEATSNSASIVVSNSNTIGDYVFSGIKMINMGTQQILPTNVTKASSSVYFATPTNIFTTQPSFQVESTGSSGVVSFTLSGSNIYSDVQLIKESGTVNDEFATNHAGIHFTNAGYTYTATEYNGDGAYQTPEGNYKIAVKIGEDWYYSDVFAIDYGSSSVTNVFAAQPSFQIVAPDDNGTVAFTLNENYTYLDVQLVKENGTADDAFAVTHAGVHFTNVGYAYTATEYKGDGAYQTPEGNYKIAVKIGEDWYYSDVFAIDYGSSSVTNVFTTQPSFQIVTPDDNGNVSFTLNENYTYLDVQLVKENGTADDSFATNHAGVHFTNVGYAYTATEYKGDGAYQTPDGNYKIAVKIGEDWYYSDVFAIKYTTSNTYNVVYGIGEGQGSGSSESVDEGTEITLASYETIGMVAPNGQIFDYWSIRIGTAQSTETARKQPNEKITINADTYIIAIWKDAPITNYTINATAGANGTISPSGEVTVAEGENKTFTITANSGYHIKDVKVNGSSVGAVSTYTFTDVATNATITVEFEIDTVSHVCNPTLVPEDEPDCLTAGKSAYYHCECGKNYEDAQGNTEIANLETWGILNALGHDPSTAWSTDGEYHWKECTRCAGQQLEKAAHSGGTATCTEKAVCSVCNAAYGNTAAHNHGTEWQKNADEHWNECACGDKANKATHTDSNNDGKCDTCEYQMSTTPNTPDDPNNTPDNPNNTPDDPNDDKDGLGTGAIVGIVIGSLAVLGGGFAVYWFVIRKRR